MNFIERAQPLVEMGIPVIRLRPSTKAAMDSGWPQLATTSIETLRKWNNETPDANCGAVASSNGIWLWEVDSRDALERIKKETGHDVIAEINTFKVRSRIGRGHFYFKQNDASRNMGNIAQTYVVGQDWSARVHAAYVVSANSIHPSTGQPYEALNWGTPIIEAPQWLIDWLLSQKTSEHAKTVYEAPRNAGGKIPHGAIHPWMVTQAGKLRNMGLSVEAIEKALLEIVHENCEPPINEDQVRTTARSFGKYEPGQPAELALTPKPEPTGPSPIVKRPHPEFPEWVMCQTSIYNNFVRPVCDKNPARIPYFMFMPAITLLLNYLGTKVQIGVKNSMALRDIPLSLFMVLVGQRGQTKKSSCIDDAIKYFHFMGLVSHANMDVKIAEGRSLIWTPGSSEGFGLGMQRSQCKNGIILYDELSVLERKASIESSTLPQTLLIGYESKKLSNSTKKTKEVFDLDPGSYVLSFLAGCTKKKFLETWAVLSKGSDGLDDRFTLILQPETLPKSIPYQAVDVLSKSQETRVLIDKAINQKMFHIVDDGPLVQAISELGFTDREEIRAEKYALAFAVDIGLTEIDEDCIERGIALVQYERAVKRSLYAVDTENRQAALQLKTRQKLEDLVSVASDHKVKKRDLHRKLNADRWGTHLWGQVFSGLVNAGIVGQDNEGNVWVIEKLGELDEADE